MQDAKQFKPLPKIPETHNFSRTIAEIEWLIFLIVSLFLVSSSPNELQHRVSLIFCSISFGFFVFFSNLKPPIQLKNPWYLAVKPWVMLIFITWVTFNTKRIESPLLELYLLIIIITVLTQKKIVILLQTCVISACYFYLNYFSPPGDNLPDLSDLAIKLSPVLLVAYLTTLLFMDINRSQKKIKRLAETDALTGILNMRAFQIVLEQERERSLRHHHHFAILMIDSDNLKTTNDVYGHFAGDALIRFTANHIQECLRQGDTLARFGGDEFLVLLAETDLKNAVLVAERVRKIIDETPILFKGHSLKTSVSIGITCADSPVETRRCGATMPLGWPVPSLARSRPYCFSTP